MAKLKATPKSFAEAVAVLNGKYSVRLGNNTNLRCTGSDPVHDYIAVTFHKTDIVKFWADGSVTLHTGGYRTATTKERLNQFIVGRVYQVAKQWYLLRPYGWSNPEAFYEGIKAAYGQDIKTEAL
jgi:hypothetical protein